MPVDAFRGKDDVDSPMLSRLQRDPFDGRVVPALSATATGAVGEQPAKQFHVEIVAAMHTSQP